MANLLNSGASWLAEQLQTHASEEVTYKRGSFTVSLSATRGETEVDTFTNEGFPVTVRSFDWLITPTDIILNTTVATPKAGDLIISGSTTYRVSNLGESGCYRKSGPYGSLLRIHAKVVSE